MEIDGDKYDVRSVLSWTDEGQDGAHLLTMPNIPHPLHGLAPRTILGKSEWDKLRKRCYYEANYTCQACGKDLHSGVAHAHEVYDINYYAGTSTFRRAVCLCPTCHVLGVHSGRALTLFKKGDPIINKSKLLNGAENLFRNLHEWNMNNPTKEPLRAYYTFLDCLKHPDLKQEIREMIKKYDIKFYRENTKRMADWGRWKLYLNGKPYNSPFSSEEDWAKKFGVVNKEKEDVPNEVEATILEMLS